MKASVLLLTYKQEDFVAEAVRAAMAQDYPNIELVVCDDGSPDRTVEFIERELKNCPPHISIVRAHSKVNQGFHANANRALAACTGDVIIGLAGDDVSLPNRVSTVCKEFATDPECMLVCSNWTRIDANGKDLGISGSLKENKVFSYATAKNKIYAHAPICGAAASYRATLWDLFPPMEAGKHGEDNCFWVRALLAGNIHYIAAPLVLWRSHEKNLSNWTPEENRGLAKAKYLRHLHAHQCMDRQWIRDVSHALETKLISRDEYQRLESIIRINRESSRLIRFSMTPAAWSLWFASVRRLFRASAKFGTLSKSVRKVLRQDLPLRLSRKLRESKY